MRPSRATVAGNAYLDLQKLARQSHRPVDEFLQIYALECFLARLVASSYSNNLVLKGGVLLAAFDERRPTRDIDLQTKEIGNNVENAQAVIAEISQVKINDGIVFDTRNITSVVMRTDDKYNGVRVSLGAGLATARLHFHIDLSTGDPISPEPQWVQVSRLLGGEITIRGYPLVMVYAEKIVTALSRGTANTRWRDFADIYLLSKHHQVDGTEMVIALRKVASHRSTRLEALGSILDGYGALSQSRWVAWRRKHMLEDRLPEDFTGVIADVVIFAEPAIDRSATGLTWKPTEGLWRQ